MGEGVLLAATRADRLGQAGLAGLGVLSYDSIEAYFGSHAPSGSGVELSAWEALRFSDDRVGLVALALQGDRVPPLDQVAFARALCNEFSLAGEPSSARTVRSTSFATMGRRLE